VLEACVVLDKAATLLATNPGPAERRTIADALEQVAHALRALP
jgi:hypothetical protein